MTGRRLATPSPGRAAALVVALAAVIGLATLAPLGVLGPLAPGALMLLPTLLLVVVLLAGRFPGERLIERWGRGRPRPRKLIAQILAPIRRSRQTLRGGRLIAAALAGRAPPAPAAG
jgi:hypothetical protein